MCVCVYTCVCVHVCVCTRVCVCMCGVHVHVHNMRVWGVWVCVFMCAWCVGVGMGVEGERLKGGDTL